MKKLLKITSLILFAYLLCFCTKNNPSSKEEISDDNTQIANMFVYEYMKDGYLWNNYISSSINPSLEKDPFTLLDKMINHNLDKWTSLTDNSESELDRFEGVSTTFGYSLSFRRFSNSQNVFAVVKYVNDDSPAKKSGIKRGDIILSFTNKELNLDNYLELYYSPNISIEMGKIERTESGATIMNNGITHSLTAVKMYEDPVNHYSIIEENGIKIGYLAYTRFVYNSHEKLNKVFASFKSSGVSEVILDLRYNPGGDARTPIYLGSFLAPYANVSKGDVFLKEKWNDSYMKYYEQKNMDLNTYFDKNCVNNLDLKRVFILTTSGSASASEATISGLKPYMDVVLVGEKTYGKYCGAALLSGDKYNSKISNWLLSMVVYKFVNANNFTDFVNGIDVNHNILDDNYYSYQFGDINDPVTNKAISIITGGKSTKAVDLNYNINAVMLPDEDMKGFYGNDIIL